MPQFNIHNTQGIDVSGDYKVVSNLWLNCITTIAVINFLLLMVVVAVLLDSIRATDETVKFNQKMAERLKAQADVALSRAKYGQEQATLFCEEVLKPKDKPCPVVNPNTWWADPRLYPLIANDPIGQGVFPPK